MRIESGEELLALCAGCEQWHGRAVGLIDGAPDDAVTWLRVLTVDQAERAVDAAMFARGHDYEHAHGLAELICQAVKVREDDWTAEEYDEEQARPLFANVDDALSYGDPTLPGGRANVLLQALHMAGGLEELPKPQGATSPAEFRACGLRGRWVALNILPGAPEVYVARLTERHLEQARLASDRQVLVGSAVCNQARHTRSVVSHVLLSGPNGGPLLAMEGEEDTEHVGRLPYGLAAFIEAVATDLGMGPGRQPAVRTFRNGQPVDQDRGGEAVKSVVVRGEVEDATGQV